MYGITWIVETIFTAHAVQRMNERRLSPEQIIKVLTAPDGVIPQSRDKDIFYKRIRGRDDNLIAVVAVKTADPRNEVLTVMVNFEVRK